MATYKSASFDDIERLRAQLVTACAGASDVETAAQAFAEQLAGASTSCALARVFIVVPNRRLPPGESEWVELFAQSVKRTDVTSATQVLSLLGTVGTERTWNDRTYSVGHRAIPLIDEDFVRAAPMIAALLSSLDVDLGTIASEIRLRTAAGRLSARFYVEDAQTTKDRDGRFVIAAREFVVKHQIHTVFGMGGAYVGGELAIAIVFTREPLREADVDRYTSLISTFKMATADNVAKDRIYATPTVLVR